MSTETPDLSSAYALNGPAASRKLYADWADSYDQGFAADADYQLPQETARAFVEAGGSGPILDVGAGTGLCGLALHASGLGPIDATDISPEMLAQALRKDVYRDVIEADLLDGVPVPRGAYAGVVSSGTFTHGHVGPEALAAVLRVAESGALLALSINAKFYDKAGFAAAFERLQHGGWITSLSLREVAIYGPRATGTHRNDTALIALFRKV